MQRGYFVTIEGGEGSGKSTQLSLLKSYCAVNKVQAHFTREPGGTPLAEQLRSVLLSQHAAPVSAQCEYLTFSAARIDHLEKVIRPAVDKNCIVFCDRFVDSSLVYQGYVRNCNVAAMMQDYQRWSDNFLPDLTIVLDMDPVIAQRRIQNRAGDANRFDRESLSFHENVRSGFMTLAKLYHNRIVILDAACDQCTLHQEIIAQLQSRNIIP